MFLTFDTILDSSVIVWQFEFMMSGQMQLMSPLLKPPFDTPIDVFTRNISFLFFWFIIFNGAFYSGAIGESELRDVIFEARRTNIVKSDELNKVPPSPSLSLPMPWAVDPFDTANNPWKVLDTNNVCHFYPLDMKCIPLKKRVQRIVVAAVRSRRPKKSVPQHVANWRFLHATYLHVGLAFRIVVKWKYTPLWWLYVLLRATEVHAWHCWLSCGVPTTYVLQITKQLKFSTLLGFSTQKGENPFQRV